MSFTVSGIVGTRAGVSKCVAQFETLLRGPTQWCVEIFEGAHQGAMIEISDVTKRGPKGDAKTSLAETSRDSAAKPHKSKNYNPH